VINHTTEVGLVLRAGGLKNVALLTAFPTISEEEWGRSEMEGRQGEEIIGPEGWALVLASGWGYGVHDNQTGMLRKKDSTTISGLGKICMTMGG